MGAVEKILAKLLGGTSDANIAFDDLRTILLSLGFQERTRGSHHLFSRSNVEEMINLQCDGHMAKRYQVR